MKIYYAHHIWKYGTEIEKYEIEVIKSTFPKAIIVNPSTDIQQPGNYNNCDGGDNPETITTEDTMRFCLNEVSRDDALVFSSVNGAIGKGVYDEIEKARVDNKPVYFIWGNMLIPFKGEFAIIPNSKTGKIYAVVKDI